MWRLCRKWRLISHPDTVNPFLASFVNYQCTLQLSAITVGDQTFFNWEGEGQLLPATLRDVFLSVPAKGLPVSNYASLICACIWHPGEFFTEREHAEGMKAVLERWYITAFQSLQVGALLWSWLPGQPLPRCHAMHKG